jgi:ADP-heptose:LPS heptosyltransferase
MKDKEKYQKIIISRVDNLGDVVLTLPVAGVLKKLYPDCRIIFLGKNYSRALIGSSNNIDDFIAWDEIRDLRPSGQVRAFRSLNADIIIHAFPRSQIAKLAFKAKIPVRLGTRRRFYHWVYCNKRVDLARRNSDIHESQLNLKLLIPLGAKDHYDLLEIPDYYGLENIKPLPDEFKKLLSEKKFNLILHPRSKGSAREWGIENFSRLIEILPKEIYKIFITGTQEDGDSIKDFLNSHESDIVNLTGKLDLTHLLSFINNADGMIAASTGPLHIASALGKYALGLYSPMRPIHPGRWKPVGKHTEYLVLNKECNDCRKSTECLCIKSITPEDVLLRLSRESNKYGFLSKWKN